MESRRRNLHKHEHTKTETKEHLRSIRKCEEVISSSCPQVEGRSSESYRVGSKIKAKQEHKKMNTEVIPFTKKDFVLDESKMQNLINFSKMKRDFLADYVLKHTPLEKNKLPLLSEEKYDSCISAFASASASSASRQSPSSTSLSISNIEPISGLNQFKMNLTHASIAHLINAKKSIGKYT